MLSLVLGSIGSTAAAVPGVASAAQLDAGVVPLPLLVKKKKKKKKKKKSGLTPEDAEPKRQAIRDAAKDDIEAERYEAAGDTLSENAAMLGDPVTMTEAGEMYLEAARADRSIDLANQSIATSRVALDMAHFYDDVGTGAASSEWVVIAPSAAGDLIVEAEEQIEAAESLIEEIEAEQAAAEESGGAVAASTPAKAKKKKEPAKPGTVLIGVGSGVAVLGAGGLGMMTAGLVIGARKQSEVEEVAEEPPSPQRDQEIDDLDKEGARANILTYIGAGVGAVGLGVGITLIVLGVKKRKQAGAAPASAMRLAPSVSRTQAGLVLSGRF